MTDLAEKIAQEHRIEFCSDGDYCERSWVECQGCEEWSGETERDHTRHVAEATEAAVREQVAREIDGWRGAGMVKNGIITRYGRAWIDGLLDAARIVRGGVS